MLHAFRACAWVLLKQRFQFHVRGLARQLLSAQLQVASSVLGIMRFGGGVRRARWLGDSGDGQRQCENELRISNGKLV